jgi:MYXO-CTERM domain-containing protein
VETFDAFPALSITSYAAGQTVPGANQFVSLSPALFTAPFFNSGGASFNDPVSNPGTPIGIFDPEGAIAGDVVSGSHVAGPLAINTDEAFNFGFMEVVFPTDVQRVGMWVTHGTFQMILKDAGNSNIATGDFQVTGSAGEFIGIARDTADIRGITMGFPESFTIDDFTYGTSVIPEPASALLAALGLGALLSRRRRK